jgi:hypothetical protein
MQFLNVLESAYTKHTVSKNVDYNLQFVGLHKTNFYGLCQSILLGSASFELCNSTDSSDNGGRIVTTRQIISALCKE